MALLIEIMKNTFVPMHDFFFSLERNIRHLFKQHRNIHLFPEQRDFSLFVLRF